MLIRHEAADVGMIPQGLDLDRVPAGSHGNRDSDQFPRRTDRVAVEQHLSIEGQHLENERRLVSAGPIRLRTRSNTAVTSSTSP